MKDNRTIGQMAADNAAKHIGSWRFIIIFNIIVFGWIVINTYLGKNAIDAFPYILLNLLFSYIAGVEAPLIMISQNRQEEIQKKTIEDIASIARATLEIASAVREQLEEQTELLEEHMHDEN